MGREEEDFLELESQLADSSTRIQELTVSLEEWKEDAARLRQVCCTTAAQENSTPKRLRAPLSLVVSTRFALISPQEILRPP